MELFAEERETNRKLMSDLSREITTLQATVSRLQSDIIDKDTVIQTKEAVVRRKNSELEAKSRALGEKDATISAMNEQITKIRKYLATKQQVSTTAIIYMHVFNSAILA